MTIKSLHQPVLSMQVELSITVENIHDLFDAAIRVIDDAGFDEQEAYMARSAVYDDPTGATALTWLIEPVSWLADVPGTRVTQRQDARFRRVA